MSSAEPTKEQLEQALATLQKVRRAAQAKNGKRYGFDRPWDEFMLRMSLLSAQSYGIRIQNYLTEKLGCETVASNLDRGDVICNGKYYEIKVSLITGSNRAANFVQIRPHQEIDGYLLLVVDTLNNNQATLFELSKAQMAAELEQMGQSAHGTKTAVENNSTREYAIRLPWVPSKGRQTTDRRRWERKYKRSHPLQPGESESPTRREPSRYPPAPLFHIQ